MGTDYLGGAKFGGSVLTCILINRDYPTNADAYKLLEECGRGVSATVSPSLAFSAVVASVHRTQMLA